MKKEKVRFLEIRFLGRAISGSLFFLAPLASLGMSAPSYEGKLECSKLNEMMRYFSRLEVGRFCDDALQECEAIKNLDQLDPKDPLRQDVEEALRQRFKTKMEVCEVAIKVNAPDYYRDHLIRPPRPLKKGSQAALPQKEASQKSETQRSTTLPPPAGDLRP